MTLGGGEDLSFDVLDLPAHANVTSLLISSQRLAFECACALRECWEPAHDARARWLRFFTVLLRVFECRKVGSSKGEQFFLRSKSLYELCWFEQWGVRLTK